MLSKPYSVHVAIEVRHAYEFYYLHGQNDLTANHFSQQKQNVSNWQNLFHGKFSGNRDLTVFNSKCEASQIEIETFR